MGKGGAGKGEHSANYNSNHIESNHIPDGVADQRHRDGHAEIDEVDYVAKCRAHGGEGGEAVAAGGMRYQRQFEEQRDLERRFRDDVPRADFP